MAKISDSKTCREQYSNAQMMVHNIPLLSMYVLGTILIWFFNFYLTILFIIYLVISNYLFMILICGFCPHYGTRSSICGYGLLAKKVTKRKSVREFRSSFLKNIAVIFPNWFLPFFIGIYLLYIDFSILILVLLIVFAVVGFAVVPYISKSKSCNSCKLRKTCPWMSLCSR